MIERHYTTTKQIAEELNVSKNTIRTWIVILGMKTPRNIKGQRQLAKKHVDQLRHMSELLDTGLYTVKGAAKFAKE